MNIWKQKVCLEMLKQHITSKITRKERFTIWLHSVVQCPDVPWSRVTSVLFCFVLFFLLQTIRFKSYLLSMGIADPVTRETHGSGTHYHMQLAKQLGDMLQAPLEVRLYVNIFVLITVSKQATHQNHTFSSYTIISYLFYKLHDQWVAVSYNNETER